MILNNQLTAYWLLNKPDNHKKRMKLLEGLYLLVENHWKEYNRQHNPNPKQLKEVLDICFGEWDIFVVDLFKKDVRMASICYHQSYKNAFMDNEEMKRIYDGLE
jgi:hypothetical protein